MGNFILPEKDRCRKCGATSVTDHHIGQGESNVNEDTFEIIKNTTELYESCYEVSERLKDVYEIVYFKLYSNVGMIKANEKIIITFRIKHK